MTQHFPPDHEERMDRARLALEGLSLGDAFGECFFSPGMYVRLKNRELPEAPWFYTDDTMMAWSIVDVLESHGRIEQTALAQCFAKRFSHQPHRGYGGGAIRLLERLGEGVSWQVASREMFDGQGSMGNGGAMRVAPVGAYFADDLECAAAEARASALVTHAHPDGQAGAIAIGVAAAAAYSDRGEKGAGRSMLQHALEMTPDGAVRERIAKAMSIAPDTAIEIAAGALGSGQRLLAGDTVPFALWCAARHLDGFENAMWATANGLGDVDTTCAMVGGIVALVVGREGLPTDWLRHREPLEE